MIIELEFSPVTFLVKLSVEAVGYYTAIEKKIAERIDQGTVFVNAGPTYEAIY